MSTRIAILLSGTGTNMIALTEAFAADARVDVALVVSNNPAAKGLVAARALGVRTVAIDHRAFAQRELHEAAIDQFLRAAKIDLICLAGYMRVLTPGFVAGWAGRILNTHPSLLPALPGLHTHARALALGVKIHGCTVHVVTEKLDDGPILGQAAVPVQPDDTAETLALRVLAQEHILYPAVVRAFIVGTAAHPPATATLYNPRPMGLTDFGPLD